MRSFLAVLFIFCSLSIGAKSMYLPFYYSSIEMEDSLTFLTDTNYLSSFSISTTDNRFTVTVIHDTLTSDRIKAIRRQKAAAVLSGIAVAAGSVSAVTSLTITPVTPLDALWQSVNYTNSLAVTGSASYMGNMALLNIAALQKLPLSINIANNTDKEITVNDMSRGLLWYVRAHDELTLSVGNPELNKFRVAYADTPNSRPCYFLIDACNGITHEDIRYEDDEYLYYQWDEFYNGSETLVRYIQRNKSTGKIEKKIMNYEQAKEFRKAHKK